MSGALDRGIEASAGAAQPSSQARGGSRSAPEEVVQVGDQLTVVVVDVDRERRRLSLSLRQA
ncbi:S1 RNA-binding domain-containing protein [Streptomyces sp. NPDC048291]|uniref:S1 RNA-binding domain-containing protein n=1 Tax=Streptomyces sp. NPDC048291 TaxID=3365530 RepID=UPI00371E7A28